jgi:hypothetical protein
LGEFNMHLVQIQHRNLGRRIAIVEEPHLVLLDAMKSAYELAVAAIDQGRPMDAVASGLRSRETLDYDALYSGRSDWKFLPAFDHPNDAAHCFVTGTGLTHRASAQNRDKMHQAKSAGELNDSMRMYLSGVDGGRPEKGSLGVQPEWFYKGTGAALRAHGQPLIQPSFADDGGEEPEVAVAYVVDSRGTPWRVGFATGNEFSDHVMEKKNYLYLAHSKLRQCAIGPELSLTLDFKELSGMVAILRNEQEVWTHAIHSGEEHMAHNLDNLEYHHFKYAEHRIPGQAHVHFLGAAAFSFGAQVQLKPGDVMQVAWTSLGRPLCNTLEIEPKAAAFDGVRTF